MHNTKRKQDFKLSISFNLSSIRADTCLSSCQAFQHADQGREEVTLDVDECPSSYTTPNMLTLFELLLGYNLHIQIEILKLNLLIIDYLFIINSGHLIVKPINICPMILVMVRLILSSFKGTFSVNLSLQRLQDERYEVGQKLLWF